jgi:hypothetical protein
MWTAFFLLYASTTARDILPADSGEFQLITAEWGIAHPPGYPLYTMIGAVWTHLVRLGSLPYRSNLLSAALAASTLLFTFNAVVLWAMKAGRGKYSATIGGLSAVFLLASAATFWAQATIANIRMPTMLFTSWGFSILARFDKDTSLPTRDKVLRELALVTGLGIGHHPSIFFVILGWVVYILLHDVQFLWTPRRWWRVIITAACAWGVPQLYLPIRGTMSDVVLNPGNLATWRGFWNHVLARGFSGDMFAFATKSDLLLRLPLLPSLFHLQFPTVCLLAIVIGWLWLLKCQKRLVLAFSVSWLIHTFVTITYRAPQTVEYLMPVYIPMVIIFGVSISAFYQYGDSLTKRLRKIVHQAVTICVVLLLGHLVINSSDFATLAVDTHIRTRTQPLLTYAPDNALILADWRWVTPLWAMQRIEDRGSTVDVSYVYPEEPKTYDQVWLDRVDNAENQPVFTTHHYDWKDWNFAPVGGGYRLYQRPLMNLPDNLGFTSHQVDLGNIRLLGYRIIGSMQPGQAVELQLAWQSLQPFDPPPSFTARIWDKEGYLITASDRYLGSDTIVGEIRFTQFTLQFPFDRCSQEIQVTVGVYTVEGSNFIDIGTDTLSEMAMKCKYPTLPVVRSWPGFISHQGPLVRGLDYDMRTSSTIYAYLHLMGPGSSLMIHSSSSEIYVPPLKVGDHFTALIPLDTPNPTFHFTRTDNSEAKYIGIPFPHPKTGERYTPFGDKIILVSSNFLLRDEFPVLNLVWTTAGPLAEDYVISARLRPNDDSWQLRHDMQPALGAIPTLKWVNSHIHILDPHPFQKLPSAPGFFDLTVYEPFRMTPLISPYGTVVNYTLP